MARSIHCRYASIADLPALDRATADHWLSSSELKSWERTRSGERRATWLAGRIVAKRLLKQCLIDERQCASVVPREIHIESHSNIDGHGTRPCVFQSGRDVQCTLSIAHTLRGAGRSGDRAGINIGADLVCGADCRPERLSWCFTLAERRWLAASQSQGPTTERLWAMKEALYKACHGGEAFMPQQIEVIPQTNFSYWVLGSSRIVRYLQSWRVDGQFAALAIADRAAAAPAATQMCGTSYRMRPVCFDESTATRKVDTGGIND